MADGAEAVLAYPMPQLRSLWKIRLKFGLTGDAFIA
jgi:hypothetical protein